MSLILDTDIDTDCDDAGALAVLHALQSRRQATILGVICSVSYACCAATVGADSGRSWEAKRASRCMANNAARP